MKSTWNTTISIDDATNLKGFFLEHDCLQHLTTELAFSVFKRYKCNAGCKVCYIGDRWIEDANLYVPKELPEQDIVDTFELFEMVSSIDDLYFIKHNYPDLFGFYERHANKMYNSSMTDIAIIQQADIVMGLDFKGVYEVSISDSFLKENQKLIDVLLDKLTALHEHKTIEKIKLIVASSDAEHDPSVQRIIKWANTNELAILIHDDITTNKRSRFKLSNKTNQATNFFAEHSHPYLILNESTYLQCDQFFLSISEATQPDSTPYATLPVADNIAGFIGDGLKAKVRFYSDQCQQIASMHNKYYDYFTFVSTSVIVNDDFTFIPNYILRKGSILHKKIQQQGFVDLPIGLVVPTGQPIMLCQFSSNPKLKLHHIPIKNLAGN